MSNKFIIYAIKWKHKPFVRLIWTTKNIIEKNSTKINRLGAMLDHFNVVNYGPKAENKELKLFLSKNYEVIEHTKVDDVDFIELESLDLKTLTVKDIKRELNYHSVMFAIDGYTVLNFNRYKVRLPKVDNNMNQSETKDLKESLATCTKQVTSLESNTFTYKPTLKDSIDVLVENLINDPEYLNSWHANIACAALDEGVAYENAQRIASRFLSNLTKCAADSLANHNKLNGQNIK